LLSAVTLDGAYDRGGPSPVGGRLAAAAAAVV